MELTGFKARLEAAVEEFLLVGGGGGSKSDMTLH